MRLLSAKKIMMLVLVICFTSALGYASDKKTIGDMSVWYKYYTGSSENEKFVAMVYLAGIADFSYALGVTKGSQTPTEIARVMAQIAESDAKHLAAPTVAIYLVACALADAIDGSKTDLLIQKYIRFQDKHNND